MTIEEMARKIGRAISLLPRGQVDRSIQALTEAHELLIQVTHGAQDPEARHAVGLLEKIITDLGVTHQEVTVARQALEEYLVKIGPVESLVPPHSRPEPDTATQSAATPRVLDPKRVDQLREKLPPQVPRPNPGGKKTHGVWIDASGRTQKIASGCDDDAEEAWRLLQQAGLSPTRRPAITEHAEMKLAVRMVNDRTTHVDVVLNNRPCTGFLGCDALLPVVLPEGYSMTVQTELP